MNKALNILLFLVFVGLNAFAQKPLNKPKDIGPKSIIEIIYADSLTGDNLNRTFYGNVKFKHRGAILTCRKAISNAQQNSIIAFGNVKILQGDTLSIEGDTLYYFGNTRKAEILGHDAILIDKDNSTLKSTQINYDLNESLAYYPNRGVIEQDSTVLKSNSGYYNTELKTFKYYGDVSIVQPNMTLNTDSLEFNSITKLAVFNTPTTIKSSDGNLTALKGQYNTDSKVSNFLGRSKVINESYSLESDSLDFDQITENGLATGHVIFTSFSDSLTIYGDEIKKENLLTKVNGNAFMIKSDGKDTLKLKAEELFAYNKEKNQNNKENIDKLIALGDVKIFRDDFQSICDSLHYAIADSVIYLNRNPIIWSEDSQLEGDTISLTLKNNRLHEVSLVSNTFIIAKDTVANFNQIKGRKTNAFFNKNNGIDKIEVAGNGQSIYFAVDEKNELIGLNNVECSKMRFNFADNQVKKIAFYGKPEAKLIPPFEIKEEEKFLEKFDWKIELKPKRADFLNYF